MCLFRFQDEQPFFLHFWRTNDGAEMNFVIKKGKKVIGVECKYADFKKPEYTRSLRSFVTKYKPACVYVVNKQFDYSTSLDSTDVRFIPYDKVEV